MNELESWKVQLTKEQHALFPQLDIPPKSHLLPLQKDDLILGLDVQYVEEKAYVGLDLWRFPNEPVGIYLKKESCEVPYIPSFFSFREGPVLKNAVEAFLQRTAFKPKILVIDGHGTAHPRKMGIAAWLGIHVQLPSIGVAKDPLLRQPIVLGEEKGSFCKMVLEGECVGYAIRTRDNVKPVFVSAGHKMSQEEARDLAFLLSGKYRSIEPLRRADQAARAYAKNAPLSGSIALD